MEDYNFGDILREARQSTGEDLVSVARKLRIRPDILERIEASDLAGMPPRGYSRNMINAYARYLGLNPTDVVKNYLDLQYRAQVENARKNIRPTGFDMSGAKRHHGLREEVHADERSRERSRAAQRASDSETGSIRASSSAAGASSRQGRRFDESSRSSRFSANAAPRPTQSRSHGGSSFDEGLFDDIDSAAAPRELSSAERALASRPPDAARTRRVGSVHVGSYNGYGQGLYNYSRQQRTASEDSDRTRRLDGSGQRPSSRRSGAASPGSTRRLSRAQDDQEDVYMHRQSRRSAQPERHSISIYAAPSNLGTGQGGFRDKLPFLIAGVIILLLVVIIGFLVNGIGSQVTSNAQQSAPMNITGLPESNSSSTSSASAGSSDASTSQDSSQSKTAESEKKVEKAPTKTVVAYSIESGKTPYIEVYDGDSCLIASSVSGPSSKSYDVTGSFTIVASPYEGLTITQDGTAVDLDDYVTNGVLRFEVNFDDVLTAWNEAHSTTTSS